MGPVRQIILAFIFILGTVLIACSSSSDEETVKTLHTKAQQHLEQQQFSEALSTYEQIVQLNREDDEAYYQKALLHIRLGTPHDVELAHLALQKVVNLNGSRVYAHVQLAQFYFLAGHPDKAGLQADAILAVNPADSDGHLIKGLSLLAGGGLRAGLPNYARRLSWILKNLRDMLN